MRREYAGARGARFFLFPGSVIARKPPTWVMVAELVETSRLWGRTAARIDPRWIEPLAPHLIKRTYDAPHWSRKQRLRRRHGAGHALRPADRRGAHGRLREHRPGALARALHPPRAGRGRLGDAPRVLPRQPRAAGGARGPRAPRAPARHRRRRPRALRLLRRAGPGRGRLRRALRPLVARRPPRGSRAAHLPRRRTSSTPTPRPRWTRGRGRSSGSRASSRFRSPTCSTRAPRATASPSTCR